MINHISIGVGNTENVANVLARLWGGYAMPFPAAPNSWMVFADDGIGTAVEVTPSNTILVPGEGLPDELDFDINVNTEDFESKFVLADFSPQYVATHLNINSKLDIEEVKALAEWEGWRCFVANRAGGLFQLIEFWIENRFMVEVMTPEMTRRYVELVQPQRWADLLGISLPERGSVAVAEKIAA